MDNYEYFEKLVMELKILLEDIDKKAISKNNILEESWLTFILGVVFGCFLMTSLLYTLTIAS